MSGGVLVLDASPLIHFARARELPALAALLKDFECVTTRAVRDELDKSSQRHPEIRDALDLAWITTVPCDDLEVLYLFAQYMNRLGNLERNAGEASVLAWAELHSAAAYVDDQVACDIGRGRGVHIHRTLHLVVNAIREGMLTESKAQDLITNLVDSDARFPRQAREDLFAWARSRNPPLLP
jgi:predicted nucleic acid-binding protein